jgi:hypothetical protein
MSELTRLEATIAGPGSAETVDELLAQARGMLPHRLSPDEALRAQASVQFGQPDWLPEPDRAARPDPATPIIGWPAARQRCGGCRPA